MEDVFREQLKKGFLAASLPLSKQAAERFERYYQNLIAYNRKVNLTAVTDREGVIRKHFIDSLLPLTFGLVPPNARCIDVGTGAGFPGVPLAVVRGDIQVTLLDSLQKRLDFLDDLCKELCLDNCATLHGRAEDYAKNKGRAAYDIVFSRAVARLATLAELCLPLAKTGGLVLAYKSAAANEEIEEARYAVSLLGGQVQSVAGSPERNVVVIKKIAPTPAVYPRKAGTPEKYPLLWQNGQE